MDRKLKKDGKKIKVDVMKDIEELIEMPTVPFIIDWKRKIPAPVKKPETIIEEESDEEKSAKSKKKDKQKKEKEAEEKKKESKTWNKEEEKSPEKQKWRK